MLQARWPDDSPLKRCADEVVKEFYSQAVTTVSQSANSPEVSGSDEVVKEGTYDPAIIATSRSTGSPTVSGSNILPVYDHNQALKQLFHFIESRNVILNIVTNIAAMRKESYCREKISMLVLDSSRYSVARLLSIECSTIEKLAVAFEEGLHDILCRGFSINLADGCFDFKELSQRCEQFLSDIGLLPGLDLRTILLRADCVLWRSTVHVLDLAVLSYAGAHLQPFDVDYLDMTMEAISILGPFMNIDRLVLRRRYFLCLDSFFNGQGAWVFEGFSNWERDRAGNQGLYLSTDAETFADVWGPMWASCLSNDSKKVMGYNVGSGMIIPWSQSPPESTRAGEVFCHWARDSGIAESSTEDKPLTLSPVDVLLIGARIKLHHNPRCTCSPASCKRLLKDLGCLHTPGTSIKSRYKDAETWQFQVGWSGSVVGYQRSYKIRTGRTLKRSLVERWKNDSKSRNLHLLEGRYGVEVSICTRNARRCRLVRLLGSQTMENILKSIVFRWVSEECRKGFFAALNSTDATSFRQLYTSHPEWQSDLGNAVALCLEALSETGTDESGDLTVFWVPEPGFEYVADLHRSQHSWTGLLRDSRDCCTMAVFGDNCLELKDLAAGRKCQSISADYWTNIETTRDRVGPENPGFTVYETSVIINESITSEPMVKKSVTRKDGAPCAAQNRWSVRRLKNGFHLPLGEQGRLTVISPLNDGSLLVKWEGAALGILSEGIARLKEKALHKAVRGYHQEHVEDEELETKPVHVLVMSTISRVHRPGEYERNLAETSSADDVHIAYPEYQSSEYRSSERPTPRRSTAGGVSTPRFIEGGISNRVLGHLERERAMKNSRTHKDARIQQEYQPQE
jgi:hypothetical protein